MILISAYLLLLVPTSFSALHPSSPCPKVFSYDSNEPENEQWYGTIHLSTDEPLVGIILDIRLDRPVEIFVSWTGTVNTDDNKRFTILKLDQKLQPGTPLNSRIMVRFNPVKGSPQVQTIRMNGKQICPPDTNFASDSLQSSQEQSNAYESRFTTERVVQRPDLDFSDDSANSRQKPPPTRVDSYTPTRRPNPSSVYDSPNRGNSVSGGGYNNQESKEPGSSYDNINRKPLVSNYTRPSSGESGRLDINGPRPSINININKDVMYSMSRPDTGYANNNDRESPKGSDHDSSDYFSKTTTKKPVVINSININIHSPDRDSGEGSGESKTTKRPSTNNNRNSTSVRVTTRRSPVNSISDGNSGYQNNRPNRNPDTTSTESSYRPNYEQNGYNQYEKFTEKPYNKGTTNLRPINSGYSEDSRPSSNPSHTHSDGGGLVRPHIPSTSKYGENGELESTNPNVKCGRVEVNPAPLITHGQNTNRGQWPWHVALYRIEGINLSYSCGGSLISATVVITAAHCVTKPPYDRPLDADILVVQLGKYHLYQFSDDAVQNKQVQTVIVHPRYNSSNYLDDLALLVLNSPAEFNKYVRPVCLWPNNNFNWPSIINREGTVVGWGYDENNQVTEELKMARMPIVSYVTCLQSYPQFFSQFTSENKTFCAGFRQGTSVCNGDSGGGMVFQMDDVWYLRGLVSITVAKQGLRVCDTNHYVVFTDIANYIDWINRYIP